MLSGGGGGGAVVAAESEGGLRFQATALSGPSKVLLVCCWTADEGRHRSTLFYLLKMSGEAFTSP